MDIASKRVFEVLQEKGVDTIYHANSVLTACQFLRNRSLMSRGTVFRKGLYQTSQISDRIDRKHGIWFDVFIDSVDIHDRARQANCYGPVLFVINSELIKRAYTGKVWVTKLNPIYWRAKKYRERWFDSVKDLENNFVRGDFGQMIVFRHCGGELPFMKYLTEIILDDSEQETRGSRIDYYSMAYGALTLAITEGGLNVRIKKRRCPNGCKCLDDYRINLDRTREMFIPRI